MDPDPLLRDRDPYQNVTDPPSRSSRSDSVADIHLDRWVGPGSSRAEFRNFPSLRLRKKIANITMQGTLKLFPKVADPHHFL